MKRRLLRGETCRPLRRPGRTLPVGRYKRTIVVRPGAPGSLADRAGGKVKRPHALSTPGVPSEPRCCRWCASLPHVPSTSAARSALEAAPLAVFQSAAGMMVGSKGGARTWPSGIHHVGLAQRKPARERKRHTMNTLQSWAVALLLAVPIGSSATAAAQTAEISVDRKACI